jgi:hypothetical protein
MRKNKLTYIFWYQNTAEISHMERRNVNSKVCYITEVSVTNITSTASVTDELTCTEHL